MIRRPLRSRRTDRLVPYTTLFRSTLCMRDHQFRLVVEIPSFGLIRDGRPRWDHGFSPFGEEKGRLAVGFLAHLARMGRIVAADAEQPAHWKAEIGRAHV